MNYYTCRKIKPDKDKFIKLKQLLKQFTHKELTEYIVNNLYIN